jgi:hypothetical protein
LRVAAESGDPLSGVNQEEKSCEVVFEVKFQGQNLNERKLFNFDNFNLVTDRKGKLRRRRRSHQKSDSENTSW